jgi:hypothetical protein
MLVEGALTPPCPGFAVGKPAMVVVRVQGAPDTVSLTDYVCAPRMMPRREVSGERCSLSPFAPYGRRRHSHIQGQLFLASYGYDWYNR